MSNDVKGKVPATMTIGEQAIFYGMSALGIIGLIGQTVNMADPEWKAARAAERAAQVQHKTSQRADLCKDFYAQDKIKSDGSALQIHNDFGPSAACVLGYNEQGEKVIKVYPFEAGPHLKPLATIPTAGLKQEQKTESSGIGTIIGPICLDDGPC